MMNFLFFLSTALAAPEVVCTLPHLAAITQELAPEATVTVLATGNEDPHRLSPTPALMAKVRDADLYVEIGMNLELWSTRLLDNAGNPGIRRGQPGHVRASEGIPVLGVPTDLTRARGDLHPEGNPHVWLDPLNGAVLAKNIAAGLSRIDPDHAADYESRAEAFQDKVWERSFGEDLVAFMGGETLERLERGGKLRPFLEAKEMSDRLGGWLKQGAGLQDKPVVFYHQSWVYFIERFDLDVVGYIEDRPGIAPTAGHREQLRAAMLNRSVGVIGVTSYYDDRLARGLAEEVGARVVQLPGDVGGTAKARDWWSLIDTLLEALE